MAKEKIIMDGPDIARAVKKIAHEIIEKNKGAKNIVFVGILEGGYPLAKRIANIIKSAAGENIDVGGIDVSFYRDDLMVKGKNITPKKSDILFSVDKKTVILVDDVLFHGRTVRAALDNLNDYGRPSRVQLAVLIDRGNRELPIQSDFCGKKISTTPDDDVKVYLAENNGTDKVTVK
ncbi:MAG: bifunctional pyr operon transcriptional regulator/uracil phosphoribosyltransferase PyrR [Candidatus Saganbacteria bacterium]|nr:bifunctional pyr operon transcriptional regulator/uracil phosphoribosyltransferase PyrR [Candidatus Saganbacteria bacterium]